MILYKNALYFRILLVLLAGTWLGCRSVKKELLFKTPYDESAFKNVYNSGAVAADGDAVAHGDRMIDEGHGYYNSIKPEDELSIRNLNDAGPVFNSGSEQNTYRVNADSIVYLPLIGGVKAGGLSRRDAAEKIQRAYQKKELLAPLIDLQIVNMRVTIVGEVVRQGTYLIGREDYELVDLLGDAGGFLPNANKNRIKIFRGNRSNPQVILVDMEDYNFMKDKNLRMRSRDVVYIEPKTSTLKIKKAQEYNTFIQLGLVFLSTLFIIIKS